MNGYMIIACFILSMVFTAISAVVTYMCFPIGIALSFALFAWAMLSVAEADRKNNDGDK